MNRPLLLFAIVVLTAISTTLAVPYVPETEVDFIDFVEYVDLAVTVNVSWVQQGNIIYEKERFSGPDVVSYADQPYLIVWHAYNLSLYNESDTWEVPASGSYEYDDDVTFGRDRLEPATVETAKNSFERYCPSQDSSLAVDAHLPEIDGSGFVRMACSEAGYAYRLTAPINMMWETDYNAATVSGYADAVSVTYCRNNGSTRYVPYEDEFYKLDWLPHDYSYSSNPFCATQLHVRMWIWPESGDANTVIIGQAHFEDFHWDDDICKSPLPCHRVHGWDSGRDYWTSLYGSSDLWHAAPAYDGGNARCTTDHEGEQYCSSDWWGLVWDETEIY